MRIKTHKDANAFLIVGLGNPGSMFERTRHNAGFLATDQICNQLEGKFEVESQFDSKMAKVLFEGQDVLICQPQTYMNESGKAVCKVAHFHKIGRGQIIILVDDADLPLGTIRLRKNGSSGGHNGLKSIAKTFGSEDYARLKIGIGREVGDLHNHVLGKFEKGEDALLNRVLERVSKQVKVAICKGFEAAMNLYNGRLTNQEK